MSTRPEKCVSKGTALSRMNCVLLPAMQDLAFSSADQGSSLTAVVLVYSYLEDGGSSYLRKVGTSISICRASYSRD